MPALSRRALLATAGAGTAGVALAACGAEAEEESDRRPGADVELLAAVSDAEHTLQGAYDDGGLSALNTKPNSDAVRAQQAERMDRLGDTEAQAPAGEPDDGVTGSPQAAVAAANEALAAYREAAALLSVEEDRRLMLESIASLAAEVAVLRDAIGEDPSPFAFVTGQEEKPYEAVESDSEETTSDETDTTSTTTTEGE